MDIDKFRTAYSERRNGANYFVRHPLVRKFQYSNGVEGCFDAGTYWLGDIFATELPSVMRAAGEGFGVIHFKSAKGKAFLHLRLQDDGPPAWSRTLDFTDMPNGEWTFFLCDEGERFALILPTEY